jgi:protein ImuA
VSSKAAALNLDPALVAQLVSVQRLEEGRGRAPTGVATLDGLLGGGWPRAALSELAGRRSSGRTALLLASLGRAIAAGETVALIDTGDRLDPRRAAACGVPLPFLLWIRCEDVARALKAADLVVAAGGFGMVALDLGEARPRLPSAAWIRLKHAAERQGTALVVAAPARVVGPFAAAAVELSPERPRFLGEGCALFSGLDARIERPRGRGKFQEAAPCAWLAFSCRN